MEVARALSRLRKDSLVVCPVGTRGTTAPEAWKLFGALVVFAVVSLTAVEGAVYRELGADYCDRQHSQRVTRRAIQLLERQGYRVTIEPAA